MIVYFAIGVDPLKFLNPPPQVSSGYLGMNFDFNCSTDDANATVKLFFAADFVNYNERTLSPEKLHLNKQVFTLLNLGVRDGGQYRCKATDGKKNIEWPSTHGLLFLSQGRWNTSIQYVQCSLHYVFFRKSNPHSIYKKLKFNQSTVVKRSLYSSQEHYICHHSVQNVMESQGIAN